MRTYLHWILALTVGSAFSCGAQVASMPKVTVACASISLDEIDLPVIPDKQISILDHGAKGDGLFLNTESLQKAIDAAAKAGGGRVVIPPGIWLSGPLQLRSKIDLHLEAGALLLFSADHSLYPIIQAPSRGWGVMPPLSGFGLEDIAITGKGIIDGAGESWRPVKRFKTTSNQWKALLQSGGVVDEKGSMWWPSQAAMEGESYLKQLSAGKKKKDIVAEDYLPARDFLRPYMVSLIDCKRVLVEGVTIKNSPKFALCPTWCDQVVIRDVKVNNEPWAQNGDGIDISACQNVLVDGCTVTAGDDGICMKSSSRSGRSGPALNKIVIRDCIVYHGHGGFVVGSNTDGGMRDIVVENCTFIGTDVGLRFKSARGRGGVVENIHIKNIFMKDIVNEAVFFDAYYESNASDTLAQPVTAETPIFRNITMEHIYCVGAEQAVYINGLAEMPVQNIKVHNSVFTAQKGVEMTHARDIALNGVTVIPEKSPVFSLKQCSGIALDAIAHPHTIGDWLKTTAMKADAVKIGNVTTLKR